MGVVGRAADLAGWSCVRGAPVPLSPQHNAAVMWTGTEVVVLGCTSGHNGVDIHLDGAAYDPVADRWRPLPPIPTGGGSQVAAAWTGTEMVIMGGYQNRPAGIFEVTAEAAAYDPATDTWRALPPAPLTPRAGAVAAWTGTELLVAGGYPAIRTDTERAFGDAAAYDPAADRWRTVPQLPARACPDGAALAYWPLEMVWAADRLVVWRPWAITTTTVNPRGRSVVGRGGIDRFEIGRDAVQWKLAVDRDPPRGVRSPIWTGTELLIPPTPPFPGSGSGPIPILVHGARYDTATRRWRPIAAIPAERGGPVAWTGDALVCWGELISVWDPDTDTWTTPETRGGRPESDSVAVWTGHEVLLVNGRELWHLAP